MREAESQVATLMGVKSDEVIFTSSSSESNNMAIKGVIDYYKYRNKLVITTELEHASISETLQQLREDITVKYVELDKFGHIDLDNLNALLQEEPVLVTIHHVNSETGIIQDIEEIGKLIKKYPKTIFHVDGTQSVGKIPVNLDNVDLFSFSAHKFFGIKGIACLIKKENIKKCDSHLTAFIIYKVFISILFEYDRDIDEKKVTKDVTAILKDGLLN